MNRYIYNGPVYVFGTCIDAQWYAETMAISENKARSNFKYQFKKQHNRTVNSKIDLPGDIVQIIQEA